MARDLRLEIEQFKSWAQPSDGHFAEWEFEYPHWHNLYSAVIAFLSSGPPETWSEDEMANVLYALARDNEMQEIANQISKRSPHLLRYIALKAIDNGEPDAKWQLVIELGTMAATIPDTESLLLRFSVDSDEYVRRQALMALARIGSPEVERLALAAWARVDQNQQWARMAALWSLQQVESSILGELLGEAEADEREFLATYARKIRADTAGS